jgi:hypothetical protein
MKTTQLKIIECSNSWGFPLTGAYNHVIFPMIVLDKS